MSRQLALEANLAPITGRGFSADDGKSLRLCGWKDSQIGRLYWPLASRVGRARTLAEVQRAVDGFETERDLDSDDVGFKQASQRVRKDFSRLRRALREAEVDDHLLIVRGGSAAWPEYTMVLRFGASAHGK